MIRLNPGQRQALLAEAVSSAIADSLLPPVRIPAVQLNEAEGPSKAEVARVVRKVVKQDMDKEILALVKDALKSEDSEKIIAELTGRTLAKFFEILFTRRGTWQSQLKL